MKRLSIAVAFLFVTACGGGSGGNLGGGNPGGSSNPSANVGDPGALITQFVFQTQGSTAPVNGVITAINPAIDGGQWSFSWQVLGPDSYNLSIHLSENSGLDPTNAMQVYSQNCGTLAAPFSSCGDTGTEHCVFTNQNLWSCGNNPANSHDLTRFLASGVPRTAFITARACNALFTHCEDRGLALQFQ